MKLQTTLRRGAVLAVWFYLARLVFAAQTPGSLDETFQPESGGVNAPITALLVQSDQRIVVTQAPLSFAPNGEGISRWLPDGRVDTSFQIGDGSDQQYGVIAMIEQLDGKLVIAGLFNAFNGESRRALVRLNVDGRNDPTFNPALPDDVPWIGSLAIDANGKILIGGPSYLARLNDDGSFDPTFVHTQIMSSVQNIVSTTNRIYIAGACGDTNGCLPLLALRLDGTPDPAFSLDTNCACNSIDTLLVQSDGKLIIGPAWLRLNANGSRDETFQIAQDVVGYHRQAALTPTGKLLLVGAFESAGKITNGTHAVQFNTDGSLDTNFARVQLDGFYPALYSCGIQANGQIVIGGYFDHVNAVPRNYIARLNGNTSLPLPLVQFSSATYNVSETSTNVVLSVERVGELSGATLFTVATSDGSALAPRNYESIGNDVRLDGSQSTYEIVIPIHDDRLVNGARTFTASLSNVLGARLGSNGTAMVTITDDEVNNRLQFSAANFPVKETQANALIEVVRDFGSTGAASVRYEIRDGSARPGRDFNRVSGTLSFVAGQFTNWFPVPIHNTHPADGNRYATLSLTEPFNGAVLGAQSNATLAILDDESPAVVVASTEAFLRAAVLDGGNHVLFDVGGAIALSEPIDIATSTTLDASGHNVVLSGENVTRLFNVATNATLTLRGLTLANGRSTNAGAIWNDGTLVLVHCTFSNNIAHGADGANGIDGQLSEGQTHDGTPGHGSCGGAIVSNGKLSATNSAFIVNATVAGNGGNGGVGAFVTNNFGGAQYSWYQTNPGISSVGGNASGGAISLLGDFVISDCRFEQNSALAGRGGDGATGYSSFGSGLSGLRRGGPGQVGQLGGSATGGALFVGHKGAVARTSFSQNFALGGDGGNGGEGGLPANYANGGDGGVAGDGSDAHGGAIFSTEELPLLNNLFQHNSALGGNGGYGGGGARSGTYGGTGGAGGVGGRGGNAEGGAVVVAGGVVSSNLFVANQSLAGIGATGGSGGSPWGSRYTSGGTGGKGGAGGVSRGGAIYFSSGAVEINSSVFRYNLSLSGAGAGGGFGPHSSSYHATFGPAAGTGGDGGDSGAAFGGAIASSATAKLSHSTFVSNRVESGAAGSGANGGSYGFAKNGGSAGSANAAAGGAVWVGNEFSSSNCIFSGNSAVAGGGGNGGSGGRTTAYDPDGSRFTYGGAGSYGGLASGGALVLASSHADITASSFTENSVHGGNGGNAGSNDSMYNNFGASPQGGAGGNARGGAIETLEGILSVRDSSFLRNFGISGNGGMAGPASYRRYSSVTALPGGPGGIVTGGGFSIISGIVAVSGCTFDLNSLQGGVGGTGGARLWSNVSGGEGGIGGESFGGGIALNDGALALTNCTFYSNSVIGGPGGIGGANNGGAMGGSGGDALGGAIHSIKGTVVLVNASFAENFPAASFGGSGGAGETNTIGPMGASGGAFGGTLANDAAQVSIVNSLFKHHSTGANAFGEFIDLGHNISSDASFAFTQSSSFNGHDPLIAPLADNGGPTRTLALLSGSPAIDSANDNVCPIVDQRGAPRPFGAHCDIGAYELNQPTFSVSGRVQEQGGVPGVIVSAGPASAVTVMNGDYVIRNLFAGSDAVVPQYSSTEFSPDIRNVSVGPSATNVNFTIKLSRAVLCFQSSDAGPSLRVRGLPMASYTLESSTNLIHWESFANARMDLRGACELRATVNTNEPHRYFRAR